MAGTVLEKAAAGHHGSWQLQLRLVALTAFAKAEAARAAIAAALAKQGCVGSVAELERSRGE